MVHYKEFFHICLDESRLRLGGNTCERETKYFKRVHERLNDSLKLN